MPRYSLTVNGDAVKVDVSERTPLLFVLRNDLGLKGAKLGCGRGNCGACTVIVNGRPNNACNTPMWDLDGAAIETVEGTGEDALLRAFLDRQAAQCGYCIPGILMGVRALLREDPDISEASLIAYLTERHICRCGTHSRILSAIRNGREA